MVMVILYVQVQTDLSDRKHFFVSTLYYKGKSNTISCRMIVQKPEFLLEPALINQQD